MLSRPSRAAVVIVLSLSIATPEVLAPPTAHAGAPDTEYSPIIGYTLAAYALITGAVLYHRHRKKQAAERARVPPDSTVTAPARPEGFLWVDPTTRSPGEGVDVAWVRSQPGGGLRLEPVLRVRDHGAAVAVSVGF